MEPTTGIEPVNLFLTKEALYRLSYVGPANQRAAKWNGTFGDRIHRSAWSGRRDSNSRLPAWKAGALPTELHPRNLNQATDLPDLNAAHQKPPIFQRPPTHAGSPVVTIDLEQAEISYTRLTPRLVVGGGFEPPKASPTDLQSVPFDRSGTPPDIITQGGRKRRCLQPHPLRQPRPGVRSLEPAEGFEPPTH